VPPTRSGNRLPSISRPGKRADRYTRPATALPVEAADNQTLSSTVARYGRVDLLCVNELGYLFHPRAAPRRFRGNAGAGTFSGPASSTLLAMLGGDRADALQTARRVALVK
jgi:hypothetical protein